MLPNFSTTCSFLKSVFLLDYLLCGHQPDEHLLLDPFSKYFEGLSLNTGPLECTRILVGKHYGVTSVHWLSFEEKGHLLKVRQSRNDFFKPKILPKNEWTNLTLLLWYLSLNVFVFYFGRNGRHKKNHLKINWPFVHFC